MHAMKTHDKQRHRNAGAAGRSAAWLGQARPGGVRILLTGAALVIGIGLISQPANAQHADEIDNTRSALEKWVETRRIISREKRDWKVGKEMLEERISLVQREIDSLREKITEAEKSITEADKKRADLVAENEKLKEASAALGDTAGRLETRTQALLEKLPDPIVQRVKPLSQRLPEDPARTELTLSERFQNVVGILNEINKFDMDITIVSEVRSFEDGTSAEVTAMYVGLGQGYYVGGDDRIAGRGTATADGWTWTPVNDAAGRIRKAIAVTRNEQVATFVQLPVVID